MKKVLKILCIIILVISTFIVSIMVIFNLSIIIRIMFFGMTVGSDENTIWWGRTTLQGLAGIKSYYHVWGELVYIFEIPISVVSILYQIIYFKIIRK